MRASAFIIVLVVNASGCSSDSNDLPPVTDDTSLKCPFPGDLPFRLDTTSFASSTNATTAMTSTRSKDESSDTLGNPGGPIASIYVTNTDAAATGPITYRGAKARTTPDGGLRETFFAGEHVSLWSYDGTAWETIGRGDTDATGYYELDDTSFTATNGKPVYAMLEGDGSCSEHYDYLFPSGEKVVVADIDGTLTLSDNELLDQIGDESYVPVKMGAAAELTQAWADKGYQVIYLTARAHIFRAETRSWLRDQGFPTGPVITTANVGDEAAAYKTAWLDRMVTDFGWDIVAAYGNADTDITAYEAAGIPKTQTFIVGPNAGMSGTEAIDNNDFTAHIAAFVDVQPANN